MKKSTHNPVTEVEVCTLLLWYVKSERNVDDIAAVIGCPRMRTNYICSTMFKQLSDEYDLWWWEPTDEEVIQKVKPFAVQLLAQAK